MYAFIKVVTIYVYSSLCMYKFQTKIRRQLQKEDLKLLLHEMVHSPQKALVPVQQYALPIPPPLQVRELKSHLLGVDVANVHSSAS